MIEGRPVIWPWIFGLLLFAILIWGMIEVATSRGADDGAGATTLQEEGAPGQSTPS